MQTFRHHPYLKVKPKPKALKLYHSQAYLGQVKKVTFYGASDNLYIEGDQNRFLEIPFVDEYFSSKVPKNSCLHLKYEASFFEDLWQAGDKLARD